MGPSKMFALNCALAATIFAMICGSFAIPINSLYAFFGLSIAGLVLALRKAGRPVGDGGGAETPLRRFLCTQAIVTALAFQVAMLITFWNEIWDDQAWPPLFAIGATALAVNFLLRIGSVARLRSPRQTIAALAFTGAAAAALLGGAAVGRARILLVPPRLHSLASATRHRNKPTCVRRKAPLFRRDVYPLRADGPVRIPGGRQSVRRAALGSVTNALPQARRPRRGIAPSPMIPRGLVIPAKAGTYWMRPDRSTLSRRVRGILSPSRERGIWRLRAAMGAGFPPTRE